MSLTVAQMVSLVNGLTVSGVTRKYNEPPTQLNTADLPCIFPRLPSQSETIASFTGLPGLDSVTVQLVVVIEPWSQSTHAVNFAAVVSLIDNLTAALKTSAAANQTIDTWIISSNITDVGTGDYWAIVADVQGSA